MNVLLLRLGFGGTLIAAFSILVLQRGAIGQILSCACVALGFLFVAIRRWVLPRIRTLRQLDLVVLGYHFAIYMVQWYSVAKLPELEAMGGVISLISVTGLLISSDVLFGFAVLFCGASWLTVRHYSGVPLTSHSILQLMVMAPLAATIIRVAVIKIYKALGDVQRQEIKKTEELRESAERLKQETARRQESELRLYQAQKNQSLGVMAAGVAHDFNNSLMAISVFAEEMQLISPDKATSQTAGKILTAVEQASRICGQMLTYAGKPSGILQSVGLSKLVREAEPLLQASVPTRVKLDIICEPANGAITGNETQLQQVLMNLVANATDAIAEKGTVSVLVSNESIDEDLSNVPANSFGAPLLAGKYVCLNVSDTGCGVTEELLLRMFDPYVTTKKTGHGFGLSTVLGIVRSHKAAMIVDSIVGKGTSITVMFPSEGMRFADSSQFRIPSQIKKRITQGGSRRVLVVDDDELVRTPLAQMLSLMNWEVEEVSNGVAAVEALRSGRQYEVLLIDFMMPGLNGYQTLKAIRESGFNTPAILCSGYIAERENGSIIKAFDEYLPKPFQRHQLEQKLNAVQTT